MGKRTSCTNSKEGWGGGGGIGEGTVVRHFNNFAIRAAGPQSRSDWRLSARLALATLDCRKKAAAAALVRGPLPLVTANTKTTAKNEYWTAQRCRRLEETSCHVWAQLPWTGLLQHRFTSPWQNLVKEVLSEQ